MSMHTVSAAIFIKTPAHCERAALNINFNHTELKKLTGCFTY